ncbi:hypothetical protein GCM10027053_24410 [Intrasporangium mesophilum]
MKVPVIDAPWPFTLCHPPPPPPTTVYVTVLTFAGTVMPTILARGPPLTFTDVAVTDVPGVLQVAAWAVGASTIAGTDHATDAAMVRREIFGARPRAPPGSDGGATSGFDCSDMILQLNLATQSVTTEQGHTG